MTLIGLDTTALNAKWHEGNRAGSSRAGIVDSQRRCRIRAVNTAAIDSRADNNAAGKNRRYDRLCSRRAATRCRNRRSRAIA